ncbi:hypothetical protein B0H11DRAFT_2248010 [Mycena galericulata]|nr:hypothetical protein B0H11DRAFT_2248010 [Mycena galericulata]
MSSSQLLHVGSTQGGTGGDGGPATAGSGGSGGTREGPRWSAHQGNNYYLTNITVFSPLLVAAHMVPPHETRAVHETLNGRSEGLRNPHESGGMGNTATIKSQKQTRTVLQTIIRGVKLVFCCGLGDNTTE